MFSDSSQVKAATNEVFLFVIFYCHLLRYLKQLFWVTVAVLLQYVI